jgi:predicted DNA-binding transcriptional regulator AlpA
MSHDSFFGEKYTGRRYLRVNELIEAGLANNRRTIFNLIRRGELPPPIKLGRCLLFPVADLEARLTALEEQAADQRSAPADTEHPAP